MQDSKILILSETAKKAMQDMKPSADGDGTAFTAAFIPRCGSSANTIRA